MFCIIYAVASNKDIKNGVTVSTPTDPYNVNPQDNFDEDEILAPLPEATNTGNSLPYDHVEKMAWEEAFTAESAAVAGEPEEMEVADLPATTEEETDVKEDVESNATLSDVLSAQSVPTVVETESVAPAPEFTTPVTPSFNVPEPVTETTETPEKGFMSATTEEEAEKRRQRWANEPQEPIVGEHPVPPAPKRRALAHIGSFFGVLFLIPIAWYLLSDASVRLHLVVNNPWKTENINIPALIELVAGLATLYLALIYARTSSFGAQFFGALLTLAGFIALIIPSKSHVLIFALDKSIGGYNAFTGNLVHHLNLDLGSGRLAMLGLVLFLAGRVGHGARKKAVARVAQQQAHAETVAKNVAEKNATPENLAE